jgi:hypothetical protein
MRTILSVVGSKNIKNIIIIAFIGKIPMPSTITSDFIEYNNIIKTTTKEASDKVLIKDRLMPPSIIIKG